MPIGERQWGAPDFECCHSDLALESSLRLNLISCFDMGGNVALQIVAWSWESDITGNSLLSVFFLMSFPILKPGAVLFGLASVAFVKVA